MSNIGELLKEDGIQIIFSDIIERAPSGKPNYQWAQKFANTKLNIK